jgi:hypothetical protein
MQKSLQVSFSPEAPTLTDNLSMIGLTVVAWQDTLPLGTE